MFKTYKGKYTPKNPEKYLGNPNNIIYRSNWEQRVFYRLDNDPGVAKWASEEFSIPYISPIDNKLHRYFPDVYVENVNGEKFVIEIKPDAQTRAPAKKARTTKRYITEVSTYLVNTAKWDAAKRFCEERNWQFQIITEKELGI
jgi:hypothetical protein